LIDHLIGVAGIWPQIPSVTKRLARLFDCGDSPALAVIIGCSLPVGAAQDASFGSLQRFLGFNGMMFAQCCLRVAQELIDGGVFVARGGRHA
jgi:hypothetical protein